MSEKRDQESHWALRKVASTWQMTGAQPAAPVRPARAGASRSRPRLGVCTLGGRGRGAPGQWREGHAVPSDAPKTKGRQSTSGWPRPHATQAGGRPAPRKHSLDVAFMYASSVSRNRKVGTQRQTRNARASPTMTPRVRRQQPPRLQGAPAEVTPVARSAALAGRVWGKALMEPARGPRETEVVVCQILCPCLQACQAAARPAEQPAPQRAAFRPRSPCPAALPKLHPLAGGRGQGRVLATLSEAAVAAIQRPAPGRDEGGPPCCM